MVRYPLKLAPFVAAMLIPCTSTLAAPAPRRAGHSVATRQPARRGVAPTRRAVPISASPRHGEVRLSAGARGPLGVVSAEKAALEIPDLRTQANVAAVVQALQELKGVKTAVIDLNTHLAVVDYDPRVTELDHFLAACKEAGFEAAEYRVESRFPKPIKLKGG